MIGSTLALAAGMAFLIVVRLSANPGAMGVIVVVGLVLVAIGCAMHLAALISHLALPTFHRFVVTAGVWLSFAVGTAFVIARAPGDDLLVALIAVPPMVGAAGLFVGGRHRWAAIGFLGLSVILSAVLAPVWLSRQGALM